MNYAEDSKRTDRQNLVTVNSRIMEWAENFFANLPEIAGGYGVRSLIQKCKDVPVIIIGSGPTLDRNIHQLAGLEDRALIISAGSNTAALQKAGVNPHLVLMADSLQGNQHCLDNVDLSKCNYVLDSFVHPDTVKRLMGAKRIYWYNSPHLPSCPFTGHLSEKSGGLGIMISGGCGATAMWSLGKTVCGGNPDILVGMTEAYYDPGTQYAKAVTEQHIVTTYAESEIAEDHHGVRCYTNPAYKSFAAWFEHAANHIQGVHINCSEGGIIKEGFNQMTLATCKASVLRQTYDIEALLFADELLVDRLYEGLVREKADSDMEIETWWSYRAFLTIMVPNTAVQPNDGCPAVPELARRMGWTDQKVAQEVIRLRTLGVNISETPAQYVPNPNLPPQPTLIYRLEEPERTVSVVEPERKKPFTPVKIDVPPEVLGAKQDKGDE